MRVTYFKGPLGLVILGDGKVIGRVKDHRPWGFVLTLDGHTFPPEPGSVAHSMGVSTTGGKVFTTSGKALAYAKALLA